MSEAAYWQEVKDGNQVGLALYERHYSAYRYADGRVRKLFVGPGQKLVLLGRDERALFVWRKFRSFAHQEGINCAVFRNEGEERSSDLILAAEEYARERWPQERFYTYVNQRAVASTNPGYCFKQAGWWNCGRTKKRNYLILEKY